MRCAWRELTPAACATRASGIAPTTGTKCERIAIANRDVIDVQRCAVCDRIAIIDHGRGIAIGSPQYIVDSNRDRAEVRAAARRADITLEDVFIGLTSHAGAAV
jgi:hypothetical protein